MNFPDDIPQSLMRRDPSQRVAGGRPFWISPLICPSVHYPCVAMGTDLFCFAHEHCRGIPSQFPGG